MKAPPAAAIAAMMTVLNVFRTWDTPPAGVNPRRILIDCQYFRLTSATRSARLSTYAREQGVELRWKRRSALGAKAGRRANSRSPKGSRYIGAHDRAQSILDACILDDR